MSQKNFFTPKDVSLLVGISYRQIQYWDKTNFIKPSASRRSGGGKTYRSYTFLDMLILDIAHTLRKEDGYSIQNLRTVVTDLKELIKQVDPETLLQSAIAIDKGRILIFTGDVYTLHSWTKRVYRVDRFRGRVDAYWPPLPAIAEEPPPPLTIQAQPQHSHVDNRREDPSHIRRIKIGDG